MNIQIFTTGGTIDKIYEEVGGVYSFSFGQSAVAEVIKNKTKLDFEYDIKTLLAKDSLDMDQADRQLIKEACQKAIENKILITHGTSTIIETARTLSGIKDKAIVLVGATKPWGFIKSDAEFNIGVAIGALNVLEKGVYIVMNGRVYDWDKCQDLDDTLLNS